jgi:hypothetical protein
LRRVRSWMTGGVASSKINSRERCPRRESSTRRVRSASNRRRPGFPAAERNTRGRLAPSSHQDPPALPKYCKIGLRSLGIRPRVSRVTASCGKNRFAHGRNTRTERT